MKKNDNFSYEKYCELINSRKSLWDEPENDYKANYIPNYLYKYWTFGSSHFDENLKRILYGTIWMPLASTLNDPFEFQMLSDSLSEEQRMEFRKDTLDRNSVLSLCSSHTNNLLWSHYSFAHTGICLEFEVVNTERLFPVIYQRYQEDYTDEITQWLEVKRNVIKKKPEEITNSERVLLAKAQKIMLVKKTDWKYEKEFRITGRKPDNDKDTDGFFINHGYWEKVTDLGIKLRRIILGFNCSIQNKAKVVELVNSANEAHVMGEMSRTDFRYSVDAVIKRLDEFAEIITVYQKVRKGNTLSLSLKELKKKGIMYGF